MTIFNPDGTVRPGRAWLYGLTASFLLFVVLPIGLWAFGVFASGPKGAGDIVKQRNSAANIAHWSATLNGLSQQIQADTASIAVARSAAQAPDATKQDQVNLEGVIQNCLTDVAAYNGDVANVLAVLPAGLPTSIPNDTCGG